MTEERRDLLKRQNSSAGSARQDYEAERWLTPRADVFESEESLTLLVDLPGVEERGLDIDVEKDTLTIRGRVKHDNFDRHELAYHEYGGSSWKRAFMLSNEIDVEKVEASFKNGVLKVQLPKSERVKPRKIVVKTV